MLRLLVRLWSFWLAFAMSPVVVLVAARRLDKSTIVPVGLGWMALLLILAIRYALTPCLRCNNLYFIREFRANPFAGRCVHCGLPLGGNVDRS